MKERSVIFKRNYLMIILCVLSAVTFFKLPANASERVEEFFYVLDEEGNPVEVDVSQEDDGIARYTLEEEEWLSEEFKSNTVGIVRFKAAEGLVYYTEVDTGRTGYLHRSMAGDAAYIRKESDGVVCKVSGVVMKVPNANIKEIVAYENCKTQVSYYSIIDGYLVHTFSYFNGDNLAMASNRVGYKLSYLAEGKKYYSYDGHYFYESFDEMIADYRNNTYNNAVNKATPYYNYYQYISLHTTAPFTAEQYDSYIAANKKTDSLMLTTGKSFVSTQNKYTINALLMYGLAINESAWGTSSIAKNKNNLFGLNAVDSSPGESANTFPSVEACIEEFAYHWMHTGYLDGMDGRYRGPHFGDKHSGVNVKYASDPYWGEKAASKSYYFDTNKVDYGRHTIAIAKSGKLSLYKEADATSKVLYTSEAASGSGKALYMFDYPVVILDKVYGKNNVLYYKVISDMSLKADRSATNVDAIYNSARDYVYVKADDVTIVFESTESAGSSVTQEQVLSSLALKNTNNYLTGFTVGGNVVDIISKAKSLNPQIGIVVKKADGTGVTSGTVATGMMIEIAVNGSTSKYTAVIRGDLNGDGKLSALDYVKLRNYLDKKSVLSGAYLQGADTSGDGRTSALDYVKLRNHLDRKSEIVQ